MKNILVVAAHPDDEILGCGATLLKHIEKGDSVYCVILGEGQTSRTEKKNKSTDEKVNELAKTAKRVSKNIGISNLFMGKLPDNKFDSLPLLSIVKIVEKVKLSVKPDIVYTHHYGDLNIDHQLTFNAVSTAFRPIPGEKPVSIFAFETVSSTEWQTRRGEWTFNPNHFVVVSKEQMIKKLDAMKLYTTELREFPHPRSLKNLEIIAMARGSVIGVEYAEAFESIRVIDD